MKDLLIVSHCILNHAAKVEQDEAELAGEYKIREELLQLVLKKDVQLFQMPCPEFIMYGSQRWGHKPLICSDLSPACIYAPSSK